MRGHDSDFPMREIDITKLRPFDIEEWRKDTTQKVYTASGHEVAKLTDFEVGDFPISGVFKQQKNAWRHSGHWICEGLAPKWQLDPPPLPDPKPEPTISRLKSDVSRLRNALEQLLNMQDSRDKYEPLRAAQKDAMEALKATARE